VWCTIRGNVGFASSPWCSSSRAPASPTSIRNGQGRRRSHREPSCTACRAAPRSRRNVPRSGSPSSRRAIAIPRASRATTNGFYSVHAVPIPEYCSCRHQGRERHDPRAVSVGGAAASLARHGGSGCRSTRCAEHLGGVRLLSIANLQRRSLLTSPPQRRPRRSVARRDPSVRTDPNYVVKVTNSHHRRSERCSQRLLVLTLPKECGWDVECEMAPLVRSHSTFHSTFQFFLSDCDDVAGEG
jgi:hypothetical protein